MNIDKQLSLLLSNLQKNQKLKHGSPHTSDEDKMTEAPTVQTATSSNLPINTAYNLINEVIMHPSIMWNRQFFYSLGAMPSGEQELMHEWFAEMNEKQKIYICEIERANDQLKETAAKMFVDKGLGREAADQFLKKVSFMENRDYFKLKRK